MAAAAFPAISFSAVVLRAGSWEAESETSPACCLGEVGSFANQWDLIRPLAAARQKRVSLYKISNMWSEMWV